jgi:hypothetical protein
MVNGGVDGKNVAKQLESFFKRFYLQTRNTSVRHQHGNVIDQINTVMSPSTPALSVIAGISLMVGGHRRDEHHAGIRNGATREIGSARRGRDKRQHSDTVHRESTIIA